MRRLEPQASLALPPISPIEVQSDASGWTVTERKPPVGYRSARQKRASQSPRKAGRSGAAQGPDSAEAGDASPGSAGAVPKGGWRDAGARDDRGEGGSFSARGVPGERDLPFGPLSGDLAQGGAGAGGASPGGPGPKQNATKGRAIENWLNHTLGQAQRPGAAAAQGAVGAAASKQLQGLSQFGIDSAALEKLGLDEKSAERVYRAMFVYSQGLHAVLQEAVGRAKSSSQALLVLWRAFTAVLEHAGQAENSGAESLAALVQRGNEEERERLEGFYRDQLNSLHAQVQKLSSERRSLQEELQCVREDEMRLRNESEMYRNEHETAMNNYEKKIKQRTEAEVRFLDKTRWCEALQEELEKERKRAKELEARLKEETAGRETAQVELEGLRTQVKVLEAQAAAYKQSVMEAAQQKQRHEQQVGQLKQQIERMTTRIAELKDQLEQESDSGKRLLEQSTGLQREIRRLERQCEDESHVRKEIQAERDSLREKCERLDKELSENMEERRNMQKMLNDLSMEHRTGQIELRRKSELLERAEAALEKLQHSHRELVDSHRQLQVEVESLREDVNHLDGQVCKESDLRKSLQQDKKQMQGQIQNLQLQLDSARHAVQSTQKELQEITETKVKLESVVRDTKSAMQKVTLEHQVELKAHTQKVAMLEKVIADERKERRNLVSETQEAVARREEALAELKRKDLEVRELKRQRLEKEEQADRCKVLLKAQEQRNSEQLVTVDKYHAAVASHDAEMRQMQVLLECEREEAARKLLELQEDFGAARQQLEQRIDYWKMCYEDMLSQLNFNPATTKIRLLEVEFKKLKKDLKDAQDTIETEINKNRSAEVEIQRRDQRIGEILAQVQVVERQRDGLSQELAATRLDFERRGMQGNDAEHCYERIKQSIETFDKIKADLEEQVEHARRENDDLVAVINKPRAEAGVQMSVQTADLAQQTDLSYQYLESSEEMHSGRGRRERLDALKKASHFVADPAEQRDFTTKLRQTPMPVAELGHGELLFDRRVRTSVPANASATTALVTSTTSAVIGTGPPASARTLRESVSGSGPVATPPEPRPTVVRPPGPPQASQRAAQAVRGSRASAGSEAEAMHVSKVKHVA